MLKGIFERSEITESNKETEDKTEQNYVKCKTFCEWKGQGGSTHSNDSYQRNDSEGKLEYFEVACENAEIGHNECEGIDDWEIADSEIFIASWVRILVPS